MKIAVKKINGLNFFTEALILPIFEGELKPSIIAVPWMDKAAPFINELLKDGDFEGKLNQIGLIYTGGSIASKRLMLLGLGKREELEADKVRSAYACAAQQIRGIKVKEFSTIMNMGDIDITPAEMAFCAVEGVSLGLYQFTPFKTIDRENIREISNFTIFESRDKLLPLIRNAVKRAEIVTRAVSFARDLVSSPGNEMTPSALAHEAVSMAAKRKNIQVSILDGKDMKKLGMNALLGVSKGSSQPPQFIIMEYKGGKTNEPPVVFVGKGLTFDSGGISIKPSEKMDEMKSDMSGGAAVMGAIMAISDLNINVNIVGLIPATENLPGGKAYKPGDVLKSLSGLTIEVVNTDAEGRIILSDALSYADRYKPDAIIDIATLTGACVVALGDNVIGMLGNNEPLKNFIKKAANHTGEKVWELPLWEEYTEQIKSDIADYKNSGGRPAGTITAAVFLSKFAGKYPWIHLDIAGPAWVTKGKPYIPKGASGVGVRLLTRFIMEWTNKKNRQ